MIYITGDMHGEQDRFSDPALKKLKKNDVLIVCGDFGFIWDGSKSEQSFLKWLGKRKYTVLFLDGGHENFDLLGSYPVTEYCGGKAQVISGNLVHLLRGQVYTIDEKKIFAFGGGDSHDRDLREDLPPFSVNLPKVAELKQGVENLKKAGGEVDYIVTHEAPGSIKGFINMDDHDMTELHRYFDEVAANCKFKKWYFGYFHQDKNITPHHCAVFKQIVKTEPDAPHK